MFCPRPGLPKRHRGAPADDQETFGTSRYLALFLPFRTISGGASRAKSTPIVAQTYMRRRRLVVAPRTFGRRQRATRSRLRTLLDTQGAAESLTKFAGRKPSKSRYRSRHVLKPTSILLSLTIYGSPHCLGARCTKSVGESRRSIAVGSRGGLHLRMIG